MTELQNTLKALMDGRNLTKFQMAHDLDMPLSTVEAFLSGKKKPNYDQVKVICDKLFIPADILMQTRYGLLMWRAADMENELSNAKSDLMEAAHKVEDLKREVLKLRGLGDEEVIG